MPLEDAFDWSFAGARRLKGIDGEVKLFRCVAAATERLGVAMIAEPLEHVQPGGAVDAP